MAPLCPELPPATTCELMVIAPSDMAVQLLPSPPFARLKSSEAVSVAACALGGRNGSVSNPATRRSTDPPPHRLLSTLCNRDLPRRRDAPLDPGTPTTLPATLPPTAAPVVRRILLSTYCVTQLLFYSVCPTQLLFYSVRPTGSSQKTDH